MAGTTRTNLSQTAINAATQLVVAEIAAGNVAIAADTLSRLDTVSKHILDRLTAVFEKDEQAQKQANSTGGGFRKGGGSNQAPGEVKFKGGKFPGKTVAEVYNLSAQDAFSQHDYKDQQGNPQAGRNYIQWMSGNDGFMGDVTKKYLESLKTAAPPPVEIKVEETEEEFTFAGGDW